MPEMTSCGICYAMVPEDSEGAHREWHKGLLGQLAQLVKDTARALRTADQHTERISQLMDSWHDQTADQRTGAASNVQPAGQADGWTCPNCGGRQFTLQLGGRRNGRIACAGCGLDVRSAD